MYGGYPILYWLQLGTSFFGNFAITIGPTIYTPAAIRASGF